MAQPRKIDYTPKMIEYLFTQVLDGEECKFRSYYYNLRFSALKKIQSILDFPFGEIVIEREYTIVTNILNASDYVEFEHNDFLLRYIKPYEVDFCFNKINSINDNDETTDEDALFSRLSEDSNIYQAEKINKIHGKEKGVFKCREVDNGYILTAIELEEYYGLLEELEEKGNAIYLEEKYDEFGQRKFAGSWEWHYFIKEFLPSNNIEVNGLNEWEETMLLNGAYKRHSDSINFYKIKMRGPNLILTEAPTAFIELWDIIYNKMLENDEVLNRRYLAVDYPKYLCYDGVVGSYFDCLFKCLVTHKPYKIKNRALLCYTFNRLKEVGLISDNWQNIAGKNYLFEGENGKLLSANGLAQSKYNISYSSKNKPKGAELIDEIIDGWCK